MSPPESLKFGLVLIDHGTRNVAANAPLEELAQELAAMRPDWLVQHAHMELAEPDLATAIADLVSRGAREILIHLHFLGAGFHVEETLPKLIEVAREAHPQITIRITEPLGQDPRIAEIILARMDGVAQPGSGTAKED